MDSERLRHKLVAIHKTLDGDYVVSVTLEDGRTFDEVYIREGSNNTWPKIAAMSGEQAIHLDAKMILEVAPSPHKVPDALAMEAWQKGESGMGYFRLNVFLRDGHVLRNVIVGRPYIIRLPTPYRSDDIIRIEHGGYH